MKHWSKRGGAAMLPSSLSGLLHNPTVLIVVAVIAALNVVAYMMQGRTHLVIVFAIFAALFYFFADKNMIIVLGGPMLLISLLQVLHARFGISTGLVEGMAAGMDPSGAAVAAANAHTPALLKAKMNDEKTMRPLAKKNAIQHTVTTTPHTNTDGDDMGTTTTTTDTSSSSSASTEPQATTTDEAFDGNVKQRGKYRVDYASTIEDGYNELNNVLGGDGVKRLTDDTHRLMTKQLALAESMKGMAPLIQSMAPLLKQAQSLMSFAPSMAADLPK